MATAIVNGIRLYYELHGPPAAQVLVLNNGILMNAAASWIFQTPVLARYYRVLQYDCRGQGQSDHPEGAYSMELHADDLHGLLSTLGISQAHIAGISYGGEVAQMFALTYPASTANLILIDTVSEVKPELKIIIESWLDALHAGDPSAFFNATITWNFSPRFIRDNPALIEDARSRYEQLDFTALIRLCEAFLQVDITERLPEIQAPTMIVVGELDLLKGREYARILHGGIPNSEYHVLRGAGHATCWERPEELNTVILGFLAKQSREVDAI